jgi:hypothetical protein
LAHAEGEEGKATFCQQKVAKKTLLKLGRAGFTGTGLNSKKFLRRFFP